MVDILKEIDAPYSKPMIIFLIAVCIMMLGMSIHMIIDGMETEPANIPLGIVIGIIFSMYLCIVCEMYYSKHIVKPDKDKE